MQQDFVVIEDPRGEFWEGALVGPLEAAALRRRGGAILPVKPSLFRRNSVSGYFRRAWGSGWPLPGSMIPEPATPMALFIATDTEEIHWLARIVPEKGKSFVGHARLVADSSQRGCLHGGIAADPRSASVDFQKVGPLDERGGVTIGGSARMRTTQEGLYGFSIWAAGNARILWAAVSQI